MKGDSQGLGIRAEPDSGVAASPGIPGVIGGSPPIRKLVLFFSRKACIDLVTLTPDRSVGGFAAKAEPTETVRAHTAADSVVFIGFSPISTGCSGVSDVVMWDRRRLVGIPTSRSWLTHSKRSTCREEASARHFAAPVCRAIAHTDPELATGFAQRVRTAAARASGLVSWDPCCAGAAAGGEASLPPAATNQASSSAEKGSLLRLAGAGIANAAARVASLNASRREETISIAVPSHAAAFAINQETGSFPSAR